jgi:pimeloyl-ACP methyl ester carboxylesterase
MISPRSLLRQIAAPHRTSARITPLARAARAALPVAIASIGAHQLSAQAMGASPYAFGVTVSGQGAPMILIPGLASPGSVWNGVVAHYRDRRQMHVLELPGMVGRPPVSDTLVLARLATDLQRYIRDQRLRRPIVVGHSVGALVALLVAIESPDLVGGVIDLDALPFAAVVQRPGATAASMRPVAGAIRAAYRQLTPEQMESQLRAGIPTLTLTPTFGDTILAWRRRSDPATMGNVTAEAVTTDLRDRVARIQAPVLLVGNYGAATDSTARIGIRASYESQASAIPRHRVVFAEHARHFVMVDDLPWLLAQMDAFLADPPR